jgi:Ca2+-binding EF-hand superfamily protein
MNMKTISSRLGLAMSVLALAACVTSLALAESPSAASDARPQCSGEHGKSQAAGDRKAHAEERFKKADKNGDGFLTQDEVGEKRWAHIQVADANKDGKISLAELAQAHAEGKLGHKHDKPPA